MTILEHLQRCSVCDSRQYIQFIAKKSKCASLAQEIGFSAPNLCSVAVAGKWCNNERPKKSLINWT
jgi:hypothetical protein